MVKINEKKPFKSLFFKVVSLLPLLSILWFPTIIYAGSLLVHADPPGCQVLVDDQYLGTTDEKGDLFFEDLAKGTHKITLQKDGYESYSKEISVKELTINLNVKLKPEAPTAEIGEREGQVKLIKKVALLAGAFLVLVLIIFMVLFFVLKKRFKPSEVKETTYQNLGEIPTPVTASAKEENDEAQTQLLTPPPSQATDFGNYFLVSKIKDGGMARIYKAKHKAKEGFYVLKIPYEQQLLDPAYKDRFLQEAKLRESLSHPNIVKIWDAGEVKGLPFFAMEYVEGYNLREILNKLVYLSEKQTIIVIYKTCEALDYAHNKGVLHKDLKPENLLIYPLSNREEEVGVVKIIDFGLHQEVEGRTGTPPYMAPEQARKTDLDDRTDLFALGVIFYELLTGIKLFSAPTQEETIQLIAQPEEVHLPKPVNPILQRIISSLLKKDKNLRLSSASMIINALDAFRFHYH